MVVEREISVIVGCPGRGLGGRVRERLVGGLPLEESESVRLRGLEEETWDWDEERRGGPSMGDSCELTVAIEGGAQSLLGEGTAG